ncbi:hypothetical protein EUX98_g1749 [Antrodiella citrinella]|uniref:Retrotransposon gag domain-containing protein n=1 Tax=Antrodiella citrinella TaxID=2447956 RepID=A0A4S4N0N2_9APHY|nr:hypothetical protein EUX98_g1749 [Antrodiella citrinella]
MLSSTLLDPGSRVPAQYEKARIRVKKFILGGVETNQHSKRTPTHTVAPTEHSPDHRPRTSHRLQTGPLTGFYAVYTSADTRVAYEWRTNQSRPGWYFIADVTNPDLPQVRERVQRIPDSYFRDPDTSYSDDESNPDSETNTDSEAEAAAQLESPVASIQEDPLPDPTATSAFLSPLASPQAGPSTLPAGRSPVRVPSPRRGSHLPSRHTSPSPSSHLRIHTPSTTPTSHSQPATTTPIVPRAPLLQPQPLSTMTTKPTELKIGQPKAFTGDRATTAAFIQACKNYFSLNGDIYDTDLKKIGFALSFMNEGIAASWAAGVIKEGQESTPASYGTWNDFITKVNTSFLPINSSADAVTKLKDLKQGSGSVDEYIAKFRTIVGLTDFKDTAFLIDKFLDGLNDRLQSRVLGNTAEMKTLDDYYGVASRLDTLYHYKNTFHSNRPKNNFRRNIRQVATADTDVTIQKLTPAERDKLRQLTHPSSVYY